MIVTSELFTLIIVFVLVSGLVVLWRRGADDLDAWGLFVMRVLRGERRRGNSSREQTKDDS
ncbi:MAG TPA: hypothetical protein VNU19_06215 [Candidatus Acidoferrum sp.]|nr:hypothetical protein [Candidatus Acidoferrum sp.]